MGSTNMVINRLCTSMETVTLFCTTILCADYCIDVCRFDETTTGIKLYFIFVLMFQVVIVSDEILTIVNATLQLDAFSWATGFNSIASSMKSIDVSSLAAMHIPLTTPITGINASSSNYLFRAQLFDSNNVLIAPESVLLPLSFVTVDSSLYGNVQISRVTQ